MKKTYKIALAVACCTIFTFGAILLWCYYHDFLATISLFAALCCSCIANDKEEPSHV